MFVKVIMYLTVSCFLMSVSISLYYQSMNIKYLGLCLIHQLFIFEHQLFCFNDVRNISNEYKAFDSIFKRKPIQAWNESDLLINVQTYRKSFPLGYVIPKPSKCRVTKKEYSSNNHVVDGYWVNWEGREEETIRSEIIILYFHGGGYIAGDIHTYSGWECHLSQLFNYSVLHIEYRQLPEFPLTAAVHDAVALYEALLEQDPTNHQRIIGMGDSAGGGLLLLTVQALINKTIPVPRLVVSISPWADLAYSGESYTKNKDIDQMINHTELEWVVAHIIGENKMTEASKIQAKNPIYSPAYGSFDKFPPMYLTVGSAELLASDSLLVYEKALAASVDVELEIGEHLMHTYPLFHLYFPEARQTLKNIHKWVVDKSKTFINL